MVKEIDKKFDVDAEEDHVVVEGPAGVVATLSPEAAADSADMLSDKAAEAFGHRHMRAAARARPK